jgi:hypothetical protein
MKYVGIATLLFAVFIPATLMAAAKDSANIKLSDPVTISGKVLKPGNYHVKWNGTSGPVQVSFLKGKDVVATAPAELINKKSPYDDAVETKEAPNKTSLLEEIDWSKMSLKFPQNVANQGRTGSAS